MFCRFLDFIDAKIVISSLIPVFGVLLAVWFAHCLLKSRENKTRKNAISDWHGNLIIELSSDYEWMHLAKTALEVRFGSILKGIINFKPVIGFSSVVFDKHSDNLLALFGGNFDRVKAVVDVYNVCRIVDNYFKMSEDRYYQREQFFLEHHLTIAQLRSSENTQHLEGHTLNWIAREQTETSVRFQTAELIPIYFELFVAGKITELLLNNREFRPLSDKQKREICNSSNERLRQIRDEVVKILRSEGKELLADIVLKKVKMSTPFYVSAPDRNRSPDSSNPGLNKNRKW